MRAPPPSTIMLMCCARKAPRGCSARATAAIKRWFECISVPEERWGQCKRGRGKGVGLPYLTEKVAARAHLRRRPKKIGQKLEDQLVLVTPWSLLPVRPKPELRESHRYLVNGPNPDSALNRCASSGIMEGRPPHRCAQITHQHGVRVREASRSASCAGARGAADRTGHEELERAEPGARQHRRAWAQSRSRLWSRWGDSGGAKARMRGQRRLT